MSPETPPDQGKRRWNGVSIAIFVLGLLILVPSGLCTGLGLVFALSPYGIRNPSMIGLSLTIGGLPMAIGIALVYAGLKSRRRD
jgi:hypothetical protein